MAAIECGRGHLYDPSLHGACPYCNTELNEVNLGTPVGEISKTMPIGMRGGSPPQQRSVLSPSVTMPPKGYAPKGQSVTDDNKTMSIMDKKLGLDPVVGWIVCFLGVDKGSQYVLRGQINTIGRSDKMNVSIKGDKTISNENHARIAYSEKTNSFNIIPAENKNIIYLNDTEIFTPTKLHAYDTIEFGESKFIFVPLCCDKFTWESCEGDANV